MQALQIRMGNNLKKDLGNLSIMSKENPEG